MNYSESLEYLHSLYRFGVKLGNDRFIELLRQLDDPHLKYPVAHVTGTKGKGSTTAMIASILKEHGLTVGGYYSPYVFDVRERVVVNGEMISQDDFAKLVAKLRPIVEEFDETSYGAITEFEFKTALGFLHFANIGVDIAAIEVGMGGRLDATNVVQPDATVITNIGLDHTHILGDTHAKIAYEKAGIIKPGIPCTTAVRVPEAYEVIFKTSVDRHSSLRRVANVEDGIDDAAIIWSGDSRCLTVKTNRGEYSDISLGLRGKFQCDNAACAIGVIEDLSNTGLFTLDHVAIHAGLRNVRLPGRMEQIKESPRVILDGAHNGMAAHALAEEIKSLEYKRLHLVLGMTEGHDPEEFLTEFAPIVNSVIATRTHWSRGIDENTILISAQSMGLETQVERDPTQAVMRALSIAGANDIILVTGSFYVLGDVDIEAVKLA